jgi:hypothetical protein
MLSVSHKRVNMVFIGRTLLLHVNMWFIRHALLLHAGNVTLC